MKKNSVKFFVFKYFDKCESPLFFSGWEFQSKMKEITNRNSYPSTLLDYAREYADITGSKLTCLDKNKSKYKFERERTLGNSIID